MRLSESEALRWASEIGLAPPQWEVVVSGDESGDQNFRYPIVVKPETDFGGKGSLGLVRIASDIEELRSAISQLRNEGLGGRCILEEYIEGPEYYFSLVIDEASGAPILRIGASGGVGYSAEDAGSVQVSYKRGLGEADITSVLEAINLDDRDLELALLSLSRIAWAAFSLGEAELLEFNPLRWDGERLRPVGFAVDFCDNHTDSALSARPAFARREAKHGRRLSPREKAVQAINLKYQDRPQVTLTELGSGDIASIVVGGGAGLFALDALDRVGLNPACFTDYSPGAGVEKLSTLVEQSLKIPGIRGVIFGAVVVSLVDVSELADAFVAGVRRSNVRNDVAMVARLAGPGEKRAREKVVDELPRVRVLGRDATIEQACNELAGILAGGPNE